MYNIYLEEKKKRDLENKKKEELKILRYKEKFQSKKKWKFNYLLIGQIPIMYRNYENRVKDFVIDMTNPHSIIEHKDVTEKITNTRVELMNELFANNPEKKRPLVFRGYITEADRIKDTVKNNKYLYYLPDYEKIKKERKKLKESSSPTNTSKYSKILKSSSLDKKDIKEKNNLINKNIKIHSPTRTLTHYKKLDKLLNEKKNNNLISQPTMRYKPRTDLERVYDVINGYNLDEKSKDIIERQLKSINLYDYKNQVILQIIQIKKKMMIIIKVIIQKV